jgi:hypothetical protein
MLLIGKMLAALIAKPIGIFMKTAPAHLIYLIRHFILIGFYRLAALRTAIQIKKNSLDIAKRTMLDIIRRTASSIPLSAALRTMILITHKKLQKVHGSLHARIFKKETLYLECLGIPDLLYAEALLPAFLGVELANRKNCLAGKHLCISKNTRRNISLAYSDTVCIIKINNRIVVILIDFACFLIGILASITLDYDM